MAKGRSALLPLGLSPSKAFALGRGGTGEHKGPHSGKRTGGQPARHQAQSHWRDPHESKPFDKLRASGDATAGVNSARTPPSSAYATPRGREPADRGEGAACADSA